MIALTYTLLSDGSSDQALMPILDWLLHQHLPQCALDGQWADLRRHPAPPRALTERIDLAIELYPCDVLFVHRDAEDASHERRKTEIVEARNASGRGRFPSICVIPVRMTEAWLLFDETAIRRAAGNPNGTVSLNMPADFERIPNPKDVLHDLLRRASELTGRRLRKFHPVKHARILAQRITDFSPLRGLLAFQALEAEVLGFATERGWLDRR